MRGGDKLSRIMSTTKAKVVIMEGTPLPKSHLEYIREIKDLLPKEAFLSDPKKNILYRWICPYAVNSIYVI